MDRGRPHYQPVMGLQIFLLRTSSVGFVCLMRGIARVKLHGHAGEIIFLHQPPAPAVQNLEHFACRAVVSVRVAVKR